MRTNLKERDGNKVTFEAEVSPEELKEAFDVKLRELVREVRIPGFRPGKAPLTMVRQKLGDEVILTDAVEAGMNLWFVQAMYDLGLEAVDRPDVDLGEQEPDIDKPLSFTATVMVMPEVKLGEYKGLKVPKDSVEVTDAEIDNRVERLQNEFSELKPVEGRCVQASDFVLGDFNATMDGAPVHELEASDYLFEVGAHMIFPEVEEQVLGMNPGDTRSCPVVLADDIPADELRGKTVEFTLTLKEIKEKVLPEVTDEWVAEVSEFKTVDEFRADIRGRLEAAKAYAILQRFRNEAVAKAVENVTVDVPEVVVQREAAELLDEFKSSIEERGGTLEGYLAATGSSFEQMVEELMPQAANNVKTKLVLDAVAKAEAFEASDEEVLANIGQMAMSNKMDPKTLEKRLRKNGRIDTLKEQILRDKAAEVIIQNAVPGPPAKESGAGKQPAAKKASKATAESTE